MPPKDCPSTAPDCPLAADHRRMIVALCGDLEGQQPGVLHVLARQGERLERIELALSKLAEHNARQSERVAELVAEAETRRSVRGVVYRWGGAVVGAVVLAATWAALPRALGWLAAAVKGQPPPSP